MDITSGSLDISGIPDAEESGRRFMCEVCYYSTNRKNNLKRHLNVHKDNIPDNPPTSTPQKHAVSITKEYICDQCAKVYKTKYGLNLHRKTHDGIFKHICQVCNRAYNQTTQFKFHCANHQELFSTKCSFCKKKFKGHSSLQRHERICTSNANVSVDDSIKFVCNECSKSFSSNDALKYHTKGKHGTPRYICETCGKPFAWRSTLKAHKELCK